MADWMRRLFHQRRDSMASVERGQDWGFAGRAACVVIDDEWRLVAIRAAGSPRERFKAACDWFLKLAKNGERALEDVGNPAIRAALDDAWNRLASETLAAAGDLRDSLRDFLDPDHDPSGHPYAAEDPGDLNLDRAFDWPEGRAS